MALTQALREKYKAITYNRSDCSYLSDEQFVEAPHTLDLLSQALPDLVALFGEANSERKSRAFDDSKVSAHTAIITTAVKIDVGQFSADERAVYLAIVKRYVAQFLAEKRYLSAEVRFDVSGQAADCGPDRGPCAGAGGRVREQLRIAAPLTFPRLGLGRMLAGDVAPRPANQAQATTGPSEVSGVNEHDVCRVDDRRHWLNIGLIRKLRW